MKKHSSKTKRGMTLVETIMIVSLYTLLMIVISSSVTELYKTNSYAISQSDEVSSARRGMTLWVRDTKEMTTAEDGNFPVVTIDEHKLSFYSDVDRDESVEYIEYELATTTIIKKIYNAIGSPATYNLSAPDEQYILSEYVQNIIQSTSTFFYFDNEGTQLSSTSPIIDVRYIKAQIIVNIDPNRSPGEFMLRSSVAPRNLKDNL
jgi:hypothetical protein